MNQKKTGFRFKSVIDADIDDLKAVFIRGQVNDSYQFFLRVPRNMVTANILNRPLVMTNSGNKHLASVIQGATSTSIVELYDGTALLKLTVAEPYLKLILRDLRKLEGAEIRLGANIYE